MSHEPRKLFSPGRRTATAIRVPAARVAVAAGALALAGCIAWGAAHHVEPVVEEVGEPIVVAQAPPPPAILPAAIQTPAPEPKIMLDESYEVKIAATPRGPLAAGQPGIELVVLPDANPVVLRAEIRRPAGLPGEYRETSMTFRWTADGGEVRALDALTSPGQAVYTPDAASGRRTVQLEAEFEIQQRGGTERVRKTASVALLVPAPGNLLKNGAIDGYEIGEYLSPDAAKRSEQVKLHRDRYMPPQWFYKVSSDMKEARIAPDVRLGLFAIDFPWKSLGMPQYVAFDLHLVAKLQDLILMLRENGIAATEFKPIYGFRSPFFNLGKIESESTTTLKAVYSMHQYGRAVDVIIDENNDNKMDDLNGDGKIDIHDAAVVMHYVNQLDRKYRTEKRMEMVGGAGVYDHHDFLEREAAVGQTPYIHVDTRGFLEPDGSLVRWHEGWPVAKEPLGWSRIDKTGHVSPAQAAR